jgi:tripartite-type tricarboxylate transporter receptor subunit TctC
MKLKHLLPALSLLAANVAFAGQTITILWPFGMGDMAANYVRAVADKANENQKEYTFVVTGAPGAGGAIAVNKALSNKNTLFSGTASFFIRKNLYPNASYDATKVRVVLPISNTPFALVTSKDKKFSDLLARKTPVTIGVAGYGTTTHVIGTRINIPNMIIVPYPALTASLQNLFSGDLDMTVDQLGTVADNPLLTVVGVTGDKKIGNFPLLTELGYDTSRLVSPQFIGAPRSMDEDMFRSIQGVLIDAFTNNPDLDRFIKLNHAVKLHVPKNLYNKWVSDNEMLFNELTAGVKVD